MDSVRAIVNASVQQVPGFGQQEPAARLQMFRPTQTPQDTVSFAAQPATNKELPFVLWAAAAPAKLTMMLADAADSWFNKTQNIASKSGLNVLA